MASVNVIIERNLRSLGDDFWPYKRVIGLIAWRVEINWVGETG
jgi:hypothetical protein